MGKKNNLWVPEGLRDKRWVKGKQEAYMEWEEEAMCGSVSYYKATRL